MRSTQQHLFSRIPSVNISRSVFKRDHTLKTTMDSGYLVPIFVDEALPGDTFTLDGSFFARMATQVVPVMDNAYFETFFFAIPNRLVMDNFVNVMGEANDYGIDSTQYTIPMLHNENGNMDGLQTIYDYMGIPIVSLNSGHYGVPLNMPFSDLYFRAYNLVWNEWFRDENLQAKVTVNKDSNDRKLGSTFTSTDVGYTLLKRGKRHDYFTSCLPWPQKGPGVAVSLGASAPVYGSGYALPLISGSSASDLGYLAITGSDKAFHQQPASGGTAPMAGDSVGSTTAHSGPLYTGIATKTALGTGDSGLYADLSQAAPITINELRTAFQIQKLYEADARGGSRYTELIRGHFSVVSPDARLQRPEYLGGSSTVINVNPVAQTSSTDSVSPSGNLTAFSTVNDVTPLFTKSFTEHTIILGLACVRSDMTYDRGLNRMFSRRSRFDFYWPVLAHLGEQAVLNKEIFAQSYSGSGDDPNEGVFGYQERWAEYRYKPSMITGKLRTGVGQSLDVWHFAQQYNSLPQLNSSFIEENPPLARAQAVQDEPQFIVDIAYRFNCVRPMPVYSVPGLVDHF